MYVYQYILYLFFLIVLFITIGTYIAVLYWMSRLMAAKWLYVDLLGMK